MVGRGKKHLLLHRLQTGSRSISDLGAGSAYYNGNNFLDGLLADKPGEDQGWDMHAGVHLGETGR